MKKNIKPKTDYWVSQERKYCEFCKCYLSANKASITFHENGKNHRDNVAKRLTAMQKKAAKEGKEAAKFANEMKKIEAAALRAYVKDIETNPDFSSQTIGKINIPEVAEPAKKSAPSPSKYKPNKATQEKPEQKWKESVSESGRKYYWNTETRESVWDAPEEGFVSLEEQGEEKTKKGKGAAFKFKKKHWKKNKPCVNKTKEETPVEIPIPFVGGDPYGKWKVVPPENETGKRVDLQLPKQETVKTVVSNVVEEFDKKFEEKRIPTAGTIESISGETQFKKRKSTAEPKRNLRQRLDSD